MSEQPELLKLSSSLVIGGFILAMILDIVTSVLIFYLDGKPLLIFGLLSILSPIGSFSTMTDFAEEADESVANAFILFVSLHIVDTLKHLNMDRDGVALRMFRS
ncbi:MAG: hypothetical protein GY761_02380 [Hyphomicrobiales bacterium]|nr:hypothetical protein [Hyphomicrobiales bacterium]